MLRLGGARPLRPVRRSPSSVRVAWVMAAYRGGERGLGEERVAAQGGMRRPYSASGPSKAGVGVENGPYFPLREVWRSGDLWTGPRGFHLRRSPDLPRPPASATCGGRRTARACRPAPSPALPSGPPAFAGQRHLRRPRDLPRPPASATCGGCRASRARRPAPSEAVSQADRSRLPASAIAGTPERPARAACGGL